MSRILLNSTVLLMAGTILFSGCASIFSKSAYTVYIHTTPPRCNVIITDKNGKEVFKGRSDAHVTLKAGAGYFSKAEYQVKLSYPGFEDKIVPIYFTLNGWYFGNILLGGVIGMLIVDPATGAMWKIIDPVIDETLEKSTASNSCAPTLNIVDVNDISKELSSKMVRVN